ncbi:MAG: hypothetical protein CMP20_01780 [Rickettsiales bacterium]|nr:hypothetical protein [Rickettsiales bacterium]
MSGCAAWDSDAWHDKQWRDWYWDGWYPIHSLWSFNSTGFDCQICDTSIEDYVIVIRHDHLIEVHEYSQLGVCFDCYSNVYETWGVNEPSLLPVKSKLVELANTTREKAAELVDKTQWLFTPDFDKQEELEYAFDNMRVVCDQYRKSPTEHNHKMLVLAEDAVERIDHSCDKAFWQSSADYGYGTLYMRITQKPGIHMPRFVASFSTEEHDTQQESQNYICLTQLKARQSCVEEVLRLSFKYVETTAQAYIGKMIT